MANEKSDSLEELIRMLKELYDNLLDMMDKAEEHYELWGKDGDSIHSDICFKKFVKLLGEFYTVQNIVSETESPFITGSSIGQSMKELGESLEYNLSETSQAREKYKQEKSTYDLNTKIGNTSADNDVPIDCTLEKLYIDDDKVANLSLTILWLENDWLRDQKKPENVFVPDVELTDTESNIIEALGDAILTGQNLLKKAGYDYSSHYRTILSNLRKRGILRRSVKGYYNPHKVQEDQK